MKSLTALALALSVSSTFGQSSDWYALDDVAMTIMDGGTAFFVLFDREHECVPFIGIAEKSEAPLEIVRLTVSTDNTNTNAWVCRAKEAKVDGLTMVSCDTPVKLEMVEDIMNSEIMLVKADFVLEESLLGEFTLNGSREAVAKAAKSCIGDNTQENSEEVSM